MEKENSSSSSSFLNCHLNWPSTEPSLNYSLPDQLQQQQQQCLLAQFQPTLGSIGHLECFNDHTSTHVQRQQWSSVGCFEQQSLNSPRKLDLFSMVGHQKQQALVSSEPPDMVGHGAGLPRLGVRLPSFAGKFPLSETGRLPRGEEGELRCVREESSASEHTASEGNSRKRRPYKMGEEGSGEVYAKRSRAEETTDGSWKDEVKPKVEVGVEEQKPAAEEVTAAKAVETPKQDYIHVRARRGQATDAHSLAERVRREKISERMKFLQNLVPGCNKVTGKAVMLDEIINYVQSLQRQVEFLSMKLATVNPRLDVNVDNLLQKDMQQASGSLSIPAYPIGSMAPTFPFAAQPPQGAAPLQEGHCSASTLNLMLPKRPLGVQQPPMLDGFTDAGSQVGIFWEDDLHKVVQMGSCQNQEGGLSRLKLDG